MSKNDKNTEIFLNRLKWAISTGTMSEMDEYQIDVYKFIFITPLKDECMVEFSEYLETLNLKKLASVMQVWVWLYQHEVKFRLCFGYNPRLPFRYNMKHIMSPRILNKTMTDYGHDELMACPLKITEEV